MSRIFKKLIGIAALTLLLALLATVSAPAQTGNTYQFKDARSHPPGTHAPMAASVKPGTIDTTKVKVNARQPIAFKPFEMVDPKTGKAVSANTPITLAN